MSQNSERKDMIDLKLRRLMDGRNFYDCSLSEQSMANKLLWESLSLLSGGVDPRLVEEGSAVGILKNTKVNKSVSDEESRQGHFE